MLSFSSHLAAGPTMCAAKRSRTADLTDPGQFSMPRTPAFAVPAPRLLARPDLKGCVREHF